MIFVTVGSQKFQFDRLLKAVDELAANGVIEEEVFAQSGACEYIPQHYACQQFLDRDEFALKMEQCDLVITHGGTGTIISALKNGKKVVAVPRLANYGEHVDDHQIQLITQFSRNNLICECMDLGKLDEAINEAYERQFTPYKSNTNQFLEKIGFFIENI